MAIGYSVNPQQISLPAAADYSAKQYYAVKENSSGQAEVCDTAGERCLGPLQNDPGAANRAATIGVGGAVPAYAGGAISLYDAVSVNSSGQFVTATTMDKYIIGFALEAAGAAGDLFALLVTHTGALASIEIGLANGKIWVGDASNDAGAVTPSGDATMTNAGVVTVTDVTVGSDATGDILYKSSATALARLGKGATGQVLVQNEGATAPEWRASLPSSKYVHHFEDFLGDRAILDVANKATDGTEPNGPWAITQTETTGNAVIHDIVADADDGQFKLGFSADSEEQAAVLYWGDEANIPGDKDPVIIFRLKVDAAAATMDSATEVAWGICDAQNNDPNACAHQASFSIDGANLDLLINSDDNSAPDADNDSTVNLTDDTFYEFKIDCADPADVQFSYRSTLGGAWTSLLGATAFPISGAANFQPFVQIHKSADTNQDAVIVDYIEAYWTRS